MKVRAQIALLVVLIFTLLLIAWNWPARRASTNRGSAGSHVEWRPYPVGGLLLVDPTRSDSTAVLLIPRGSLLMVPHEVQNPDGTAVRSSAAGKLPGGDF